MQYVPLVLFMLTGLVLAEGEKNIELRRAEIRSKLAHDLLDYAEKALKDSRVALEAGRLTTAQLRTAELVRSVAAAEQDVALMNLDEVRATGQAPDDDMAASKSGGRDFVLARLNVRKRLAELRQAAARSKAKGAKGLAAAGQLSREQLSAAEAEVFVAEIVNTETRELWELRKRFVAGAIDGEKVKLLALRSRYRQAQLRASLRNSAAGARLVRTHTAWRAGTATAEDRRAAEAAVLRTRAEIDLARIELERIERKLAPK